MGAMRDRKVETLKDVLSRVVRTLDIEKQLLTHAVGPVWERAMGERLARHTRAAQLRAGVLTVEARSAAWMNEAAMQRDQIRERMNLELGGQHVREVRFRLGGAFPPLRPVNDEPKHLPTEVEVESARRALSHDGGDTGAELTARAMALALKRHKAR